MTQFALFERHFPTLDDAEVANAASVDGLTVSMVARKGVPDIFVVKFATEKGAFRPIVMNRKTAEMLRQILQQEGF
jgi:hypothetical protein